MPTRHGTMATDRPERYAKQLAGHWARKSATSQDEEGATVIRMESGGVVVLRPSTGVLAIEASVPEGGDADRWAQVVKDHLERFGQRDELNVVWQES